MIVENKDLLKENEPVNEGAKKAAEELSKKEIIEEEDIFDIALKNDTSLSEEDKEMMEKLKENKYDFRKTLNQSMEDVFIKAYTEFIEENIDNIKYFLSSEEPEKAINPSYNLSVNGVTYKWKDEFFIEVDSFKTTKKELSENGEVKLYLISIDKIQEAVTNIPLERFQKNLDEVLKEIKEEDNNTKKPTLEDVRMAFFHSLSYIVDKIQLKASKSHFDNKYRYGDVFILDKLLNPEKIKGLYESANKLDRNALANSNRSYLGKFIKRIEKDFKKNNLNLDENNREALRVMAEQLSELFLIVFTHAENELNGSSADLEVTIKNIKEEEKNKEFNKKRNIFKNVIIKALYKTFVDHMSRASIPALSFSFQNRDLEDSYVMVRLFEVADYILKPKKEEEKVD